MALPVALEPVKRFSDAGEARKQLLAATGIGEEQVGEIYRDACKGVDLSGQSTVQV